MQKKKLHTPSANCSYRNFSDLLVSVNVAKIEPKNIFCQLYT